MFHETFYYIVASGIQTIVIFHMLTTICLRICSTLVGVHEVMTMVNSISCEECMVQTILLCLNQSMFNAKISMFRKRCKSKHKSKVHATLDLNMLKGYPWKLKLLQNLNTTHQTQYILHGGQCCNLFWGSMQLINVEWNGMVLKCNGRKQMTRLGKVLCSSPHAKWLISK